MASRPALPFLRHGIFLVAILSWVVGWIAWSSGCSADARTTAAPAEDAIMVSEGYGLTRWYIPSPEDPTVYVPFKSQAWWAIGLIAFGLVGQLAFMSRFLVQWIASERRGRSVVPIGFWWLSLVGATMLLIYFAIRRDPVGVLGQMFGGPIYARNLLLIYKMRARKGLGSESSEA